MEELKYRKIKCSQGHWSKVFHQGEQMPGECPECGQPYNRRRNRPVACREDGTIPDSGEEINDDKNRNNTPQSDIKDTVSSEPQIGTRDIKDTVSSEPQIGTRRRRQANLSSYSQEQVPPVSFNDPHPSARRRAAIKGNAQKGVDPITRQYYIVSAGRKIQISDEGEQIGREGPYEEMCVLNRLISRNHAQISLDHKRGGVRLIDMNSLNGTFVDNGEGRRRLKEQEVVIIKTGDRFWLADQLFIVDSDPDN